MINIFIEALGGQVNLAKKLGCSQTLVSKWLSGRKIAGTWKGKFISLAKEYKIQISDCAISSFFESESVSKEVRTGNINENNKLGIIVEPKVRTGNIQVLPFCSTIEKQQEVDGIGMGVLSDGTPFLNIAGLARLCGVDEKAIRSIRDGWSSKSPFPRVTAIKSILESRGATVSSFCLEIPLRSTVYYACTDVVSMAVLEYYAFDAKVADNSIASKNYRLLANLGLRAFIYNQVGYDPRRQVPISWQIFRDRVSLVYNAVPLGYFCVFKEVSDIILAIIAAGGTIDSKFIPDISIGISWSNYWKEHNLHEKYGVPKNYAHNYPDYFPQSKSNPQPAKCYPEEALGEFRRWMRDVYLAQGKFRNYLSKKEKCGELPPSFAQLAVTSYSESLGIKASKQNESPKNS